MYAGAVLRIKETSEWGDISMATVEPETGTIDQEKMQALVGRVVSDFGATASAALRSVAEEAGFTRFRRAVDTPFNRLFEVRP